MPGAIGTGYILGPVSGGIRRHSQHSGSRVVNSQSSIDI